MSDELENTTETPGRSYARLDDLEKQNISPTSRRRLEYVLRTLNEADELNGNLCWSTEVWDGCTVEELLGGLIEAENLLEQSQSSPRHTNRR